MPGFKRGGHGETKLLPEGSSHLHAGGDSMRPGGKRWRPGPRRLPPKPFYEIRPTLSGVLLRIPGMKVRLSLPIAFGQSFVQAGVFKHPLSSHALAARTVRRTMAGQMSPVPSGTTLRLRSVAGVFLSQIWSCHLRRSRRRTSLSGRLCAQHCRPCCRFCLPQRRQGRRPLRPTGGGLQTFSAGGRAHLLSHRGQINCLGSAAAAVLWRARPRHSQRGKSARRANLLEIHYAFRGRRQSCTTCLSARPCQCLSAHQGPRPVWRFAGQSAQFALLPRTRASALSPIARPLWLCRL